MQDDRFFSMPPGAIIPGKLGKFSIYLKKESSNSTVLFAKAGEMVDSKVLDRLEEMGVEEVFISTADKINFDKYIETNLNSILSNKTVAVEKRTAVFTKISVNIIKDSFENFTERGLDRALINRLESLVRNTTQFLTDQNTLKVLSRMIGHDYNTYRHSMMVFWYSSILLKNCEGLVPATDMEDVEDYHIQGGVAAILHDIGKTMIDPKIINKPDRLTDTEFEIIKTHSVNSLAMLIDTELNPLVKKAILHHHEDYNGGGYPFGISGSKIPFLSRLIRVVDVFEAMTSNRPYKTAMSPGRTIELMTGIKISKSSINENQGEEDARDRDMNKCFDNDILKRFIVLLSKNIKL